MCHVQKQSVDAAPVASQGLAHVLCATTLHRAGFTKRAPVKLCPVEDSGRLSLRKCSSPQASLGGQPSIGTHLTAEPASRGLVLASVPPPACTPRLCQHAAEDRSRLIQDPTCVTDTITCQPASLVLSCPDTTGNQHHGNARIALCDSVIHSRLQAQCRTPEHKPGDGLGLKTLCQLLSCCWWVRRQITAGPGHGLTTHLAARHHAAPSPRFAAPGSSSGECVLKIDHARRLHASAPSLGPHLFSEPDPTSPIRTPEGGLHLSIFPRLIH